MLRRHSSHHAGMVLRDHPRPLTNDEGMVTRIGEFESLRIVESLCSFGWFGFGRMWSFVWESTFM